MSLNLKKIICSGLSFRLSIKSTYLFTPILAHTSFFSGKETENKNLVKGYQVILRKHTKAEQNGEEEQVVRGARRP
jgi:hypothetical protein